MVSIGGKLGQLGRQLDDFAHNVVDEALEDPIETVLTLGNNVVFSIVAEDIIGGLIIDPLIEKFTEKQPETTDQISGVAVTQIGADKYIPVIYGEDGVTGGILIAPPFISGDTNEYASFVFVLCEGAVSNIKTFINGIESDDAIYDGLVTIETKTGHTGQTSFTLLTSIEDKWTEDHKLSGLAAVHVRLKRDPELFRGFPKFHFTLKGKQVSRVNSVGTDSSSNPISQAIDYLRSDYHGKGLPYFDDSPWVEAYSTCENYVSMVDGGNDQARYTNNLTIDTGQTMKQNLMAILKSCRGTIVDSDVLRPVVATSGAAIFSFNATNIIGSVSVKLPNKDTILNRMTVKYRDVDNINTPAISTYDSETLRTDDGGFILSKDLTLPGINNGPEAKVFGHTAVKKSRDSMSISFSSSFSCMLIEVGDIVDLTEESYGFTDKPFIVSGKSFNPMTGQIKFSMLEHFDTFYDVDVSPEEETPADTTLPNPAQRPPDPTNLILTSGEAVYGEYLSASILVEWDASVDFFHREFEIKYSVGADEIVKPIRGNKYLINPVVTGAVYDISVTAINQLGISSLPTVGSIEAEGNETPPPDVDTFFVTLQLDGTRVFDGTYLNRPIDFIGYRVKYSLGPGGIWDNMTNLTSDTIPAFPFETNLLDAGEYTMAIKAVDNAGNESINELYIESTLPDGRQGEVIFRQNYHESGYPNYDTATTEIGGNGELVAKEDISTGPTWDDFNGTTWDDALYAGTPWTSSPFDPASYETPVIDNGSISSLTPTFSIPTGSGFEYVVNVRVSDDNIVWTPYEVASGDVSGRYVQLRVDFTVDNVAEPNAVPQLWDFTVTLSGELKDESWNDVDTALLTQESPGGVRLPLNKSYSSIKNIYIAVQGQTGNTTWTQADKDVGLGPWIIFKDSAGAYTYPLIDYRIEGL